MGLRSLLGGNVSKETIKRITCPMDPSRYYELPALVSEFRKIKRNKKVLDISSPKLATYYLADRYKKSQFIGTDIQEKEIKAWKDSFGELKNLKLETHDARKMNYPDNTFDVVYSISTVEHVLDGKGNNDYGDRKVVNEAYRVLKKGGILILTTMISKNSNVLYKDNNIYGLNGKLKNKAKYFFAREYSKSDIYKRLINNTNFKLVHFEFCKYKSTWYEDLFNKLVPLSALFGFLNIFFMPNLIKIHKDIDSDYGNRSDCLMILKK